MAPTRRYTIEIKDARSKAVELAAAVDWTNDERHLAVTRIFRLPGLAGSNGLIHRLSQQRSAKREPATTTTDVARQPGRPLNQHAGFADGQPHDSRLESVTIERRPAVITHRPAFASCSRPDPNRGLSARSR